ncbi:MAG: beta strand repeat-containing protein, partial [Weeksellaceae bacterium]
TVGNSASAGSNKISGLYLGDTSPLYFGADNDINFSFNNALSTLQIAMGNNDLNFDSDTLFIDGSASTVGIGTTVATSKLNVGGDILLAGTGADTLSSNANELVLQQTGDTYGTTRLRLQHRDGANGAIFENAGSHELVDFGFRTPSAVTRNIRLENRGSAVAGSPTFHIGGANPDAPSLGVGDSYVAVAGSLVIGGYTQPGNNLSVLGTGYVSGNFGLGTASPDFALQVNGVVAPETTDQDMGTSSLRWDIFGNTINADSTVTLTGLGTGVDNTVLVLDSSNNVTTDEIDARVWGTTLLDSSTGAANYLARFTDGDTLGIGTVYDTGTNVGIGTTNPAETLDVQGNVRLTTSQFRIANETAFSAEGSIVEGDWEQYVLAGTGVNRTLRMGVTNDGYTKSEIEFENNNSVNGTIALKTSDGSVGSAIRLFVNGLGNIGIGTTAPNERLDLRGAIYIGDTSAPGVTTNRLYATSGNLFWNGTQLNAGGASPFTDGGTYLYPTANETLGNSASAGANKLTGIYLGDSSPLSFGLDNDIGFNYNNATSMLNVTQGSADVNFDANTLFVDGSANAVGIGTTTPGAQLDVAGRVKLGSNITYANNTTQVIIGSNNGSDPQCGLWSCGLAYNEQLNSLAASGGYYGTLGSVTNNTAGSNFVVGAHYAANTLVNSGAVEGVAASANVGAGVTVSSNIRGLFTSVGSSHSSGVATIAEATSIWSFDNFADNTNITNLYGIKSQLSGLGTGSIISNLYGHYIDADSSDGTVTKSFGLYITNVRDPAFAAANDFGIYQEGSNDYNYFAGNLGIGTSAPTQAFQVVGNSIISGYTKINNVAIGGSAPGITGCNDFSDMICGGSNLWLGASSGGGQVYFEDDLNINGQDITAAGSFSGAGLTDCDTTNSKLLWDSTSGDFSCGTDRASATIVKPTVEAVTSSTIPQADDHLTFSVGANETWVVQYNLRVSSPNLGGIAVGVSAPSGANCKFVAGELENNVANAQNGCAVTAATAMNLGTGVLTTDPAIVYGMVTTGATSGNVELWWAQATANATPSRVHEGSFLIAFKSSGADLAESYNTRDKSIKPGDVVSVDPTLKNGVKKSTGAYDEKVLGIVPTQPGIVLSDGSPPVGTKSVLLALAGRVPVKVNLENGPIKAGDYLTTSSIPGEAMKATKSGIAIGKALEDYNGSSSTIFEEGKVMTFVELGYYSPDIKLNADGNLDVVVENDKYVAKYTDGSTIEQKGGFAEAVIASLTSGKIDVKELFLGDIDVRAKLEELIAAQDGNQIQLQSLLSQLNEQENLTASQAAQLAANTQQLSAMQNASGSGEMQASSSGLIAQLSDRVSFLEQMLYGQDVGAVLGVQSGGIASESGSLSELLVDKPIRFSEDTIFDEDLTVLGDARFNDISLTGAISNGLLTINGFDDSTATPSATISTLNGSLKLQHLGLGEVDIMAGKVRIDTQGNMIIAEGVLKGNDEFRGTIKLPRNAKSVRVDRNWTEAPATVIASPDFETYVWISELDEDGFTINVKDSSTQAQDLFWAAIF